MNEFKYLEHIIINDKRDDKDVLREVRGLSKRANILARRFKMCRFRLKLLCLNHFVYVLWYGVMMEILHSWYY